jgi:hypothetical protein
VPLDEKDMAGFREQLMRCPRKEGGLEGGCGEVEQLRQAGWRQLRSKNEWRRVEVSLWHSCENVGTAQSRIEQAVRVENVVKEVSGNEQREEKRSNYTKGMKGARVQ